MKTMWKISINRETEGLSFVLGIQFNEFCRRYGDAFDGKLISVFFCLYQTQHIGIGAKGDTSCMIGSPDT